MRSPEEVYNHIARARGFVSKIRQQAPEDANGRAARDAAAALVALADVCERQQHELDQIRHQGQQR